jgi:hypothetical protein
VELVLESAAFARAVLREKYPSASLLALHEKRPAENVSGQEMHRKQLSKAVLFPARLLYVHKHISFWKSPFTPVTRFDQRPS